MNTRLIYDGPSELTGGAILVFATNLTHGSANPKTGDMVGTYILTKSERPMAALRSGEDKHVCGGCPLRPQALPSLSRGCYVQVGQAPESIYRAWERGNIPAATPNELAALGANRLVRLGSYGDPAAVPTWVWTNLLARATDWTGYTHAWRSRKADPYKQWCQASVESDRDQARAAARGWGTFQVIETGGARAHGTACPASAEMGHIATCSTCLKCDGTSRNHVTIQAHGAGKKWVPVYAPTT